MSRLAKRSARSEVAFVSPPIPPMLSSAPTPLGVVVFASSKLATPVAAVADRPVQCERPEPPLFGRATDRTSRILETGNARLWSADGNPLMAFTFLRGCLLREQ